MSAYDVQLSPASSRVFEKQAPEVRARIRQGLQVLAVDVAKPGRIGGKAVKSIQGAGDSFHRLRVGDYRIMYDVFDADRVVLVLGSIHRGELERWIRNR